MKKILFLISISMLVISCSSDKSFDFSFYDALDNDTLVYKLPLNEDSDETTSGIRTIVLKDTKIVSGETIIYTLKIVLETNSTQLTSVTYTSEFPTSGDGALVVSCQGTGCLNVTLSSSTLSFQKTLLTGFDDTGEAKFKVTGTIDL